VGKNVFKAYLIFLCAHLLMVTLKFILRGSWSSVDLQINAILSLLMIPLIFLKILDLDSKDYFDGLSLHEVL